MRSNKRERVKKAIEMMIDHCNNKYFNLVWYARCDQKKRMQEECYEALASCRRIEQQYPKEIAVLTDPNDDNWAHGFNSGMLAASRYYLTIIDDGIEQADLEFPMLDS